VSRAAAKKWRQCAGKFVTDGTQITVSVCSRNVQGSSQKIASVCRRRIEGRSQKIASVCRGNVVVGTQKIASVCNRSFDDGILEKCEGWQP
jgi:hypothetical protein